MNLPRSRLLEVILGLSLGSVCVLVLINHPGWPLAIVILKPFAELGFVIGNVHQGSNVVTTVALLMVAGLCGWFVVAVSASVWRWLIRS
jgi:hypothetical protein